MKTILLSLTAAVAMAAGTSEALARLGETPDECILRYSASTGQSGRYIMYAKGHIQVAVLFDNGISVLEIFSPEPGDRLSDEQISELLIANSKGLVWTTNDMNADPRHYRRADGASAKLHNRTLTVSTATAGAPSTTVVEKRPPSGF